MGRDRFDAAHIDCPVAGKTVNFIVLIGRPMICPECRELVEPSIFIGAEVEAQYPFFKERLS